MAVAQSGGMRTLATTEMKVKMARPMAVKPDEDGIASRGSSMHEHHVHNTRKHWDTTYAAWAT